MKLIEVSPMGNMANRMIQYMVALALADRVPGARLAKIHLPEWRIQIAPFEGDAPRTEIVQTSSVDLDRLATALNDGSLDRVDIRTYGQRMENFLPPDAYRGVFHAPAPAEGAGSADELVCNIRQGDILDAHHPDYVLVPIDFYADLLARTGLKPVFCGQLETTPYLKLLKKRFPRARYVPSRGAVADFEFLRASRNIVPSVSSFAWLAAWLSAAERIFMPVLGVLHPLQVPPVNLLPLGDPRFSFYLFPFHYAVPVAEAAAAHKTLLGLWRLMPPERLRCLFAAPVPPKSEWFDEDFYLGAYPDIRQAVMEGHFPSGRHHYDTFGRAEGRACCDVDRAWYCRTYPMAAFELGQGDATDPLQHWIELGRSRGYQPTSGHKNGLS